MSYGKYIDAQITKSNELARAAEVVVDDPKAAELRLIRSQIDQRLVVHARRILETFISQVDPAHPEKRVVEVRKRDLEQAGGANLHANDYENLCRSLTRLGYELRTKDRFFVAILIEWAEYISDEGLLRASFTSKGMEFIAVQRLYTKMALIDYLALSGGYAQRLYQLLKSWESQKEGFFQSLSEFYNYLNLPEIYRKNAAELKRRVLEPARKEMAKKLDFHFQYFIDRKQKRIVFGWGKQEDLPSRPKRQPKQETPLSAAKKCAKGKLQEGGYCSRYMLDVQQYDSAFDEKKCFACRKRKLLKDKSGLF